ncbi:hypothetical protein HS088_TW14G00640 [Tripterygium wilfordii]|uniref:Uncharacterized protein n=1 Tax=Tripterygium wilfordii TaxID=458696 RepID=A0A7J7CQY1_TRIWF|nr:uncharacterized protein LOC120014626 [Tripterygium wilfordii]KAF5736497.1 hypothetical protein HS088_TW14G00640 [Tripterygium wilfordii]
MEISISRFKIQAVCSSFPFHRITKSSHRPQKNFMVQLKPRKLPKHGLAVDCAKWDSSAPVIEPERELGEEEELDPEVKDWMKTKLKNKCRDRSAMSELLECLEREIMGEDEGKEPLDYNRRAHIFDKSSRVFQALKERTTPQQS